jgi:hypothetical protein
MLGVRWWLGRFCLFDVMMDLDFLIVSGPVLIWSLLGRLSRYLRVDRQVYVW